MSTKKSLNDIFTTEHLDRIIQKATGEKCYKLVSEELRPAAVGAIGYLGDHYRLGLRVRLPREERTLHLFVKTLPMANQGKRDFIVAGNFFRREELMYQLFEDIGGDDGHNPWHPKAFLCTDSLLVMPDLSCEGYTSQPPCECSDLPHALLATASIARFHAAFANYDTTQTSNGNRYSFFRKYEDLLLDPGFCDSPWLRAAAAVSTSLIKTYSKHKDIPNLNEKMTKLFIEACDTMKEYDETLNVAIHRDLWTNNLLFRYENNIPVNAILLDYQCLRYGPPAFDLAVYLYLQTSKIFRKAHEKELCIHYYKIFLENVNQATRQRLAMLGYSLEDFLNWYERARMLGMVVALGILPCILMDPLTARRVFDDPATFQKHYTEDRSEPVLEYCQQNSVFRDRQVELTEEFIENYLLKNV